jgi:hypothetical protein
MTWSPLCGASHGSPCVTRRGVLRRESRPFDDWATLDAVACGDKELSLQTHKGVPNGTRKNNPGWQFILEFLCVLDDQASIRCKRLNAAFKAGTVTDFQDSESESEGDMDDFLAEFTGTLAWAKLSKPSPEQ